MYFKSPYIREMYNFEVTTESNEDAHKSLVPRNDRF